MIAKAATSTSYPDLDVWSQATSTQQNVWSFQLADSAFTFAEDGSVTRTGPPTFSGVYVYAYNLSGSFYVPQNATVMLSNLQGRYVFEYVNQPIRGTLQAAITGTGNAAVSTLFAGGDVSGTLHVYNPLGHADYYLPSGSTVVAVPVIQANGDKNVRYEILGVSTCPSLVS